MSSDDSLVVLPVNADLTDGKSDTWPSPTHTHDWAQADDARWLGSLGDMWVEKTGAKETDVKYKLDQLPGGYAVFDRARGNNREIRDVFLYGHPSGHYYQSRKAFFPHFWWLMTGKRGSCECVPCQGYTGGRKVRKRRTKAEMQAARAAESQQAGPSKRPRAGAAKKIAATATPVTSMLQTTETDYPGDSQGPDYWKVHIAQMKERGQSDDKIKHLLNMDWVLTNELLADHFVQLSLQAAFIPRRGELVLWAYEIDGKLEWNAEKKAFLIRKDNNKWIAPQWRAGVVTQTPTEETTFLDIVTETSKTSQLVSYWGFRVETLPDPLNDEDKSFSSQYNYVPLKCIKPFNSWEKFLHGISRDDLHPSIEHAMTVMASWSLLSHHRFSGTWPNPEIHSRGIFIGSELVTVRDTVRLKPFGLQKHEMEEGGNVLHPEVDPVDVLVVEGIWLSLKNPCEDFKDPALAEKCTPFISGKVYTRDPNRLSRDLPFAKDPLQKMSYDDTLGAFRQVGMSSYGDWYRVAGGRSCIVSPSLILGRCYEPEALMLHFNTSRLDYDLHGVLSGRQYSGEIDVRIPEGSKWFWGDNRVETLGLVKVNGVDVGVGAEQRTDPERWLAIMKILRFPYADKEIKRAQLPRTRGRPPKSKFTEMRKTSELVRTGLGVSAGSSTEEVIGKYESESEAGLSERELTAPVLFRGGTEESEGGDYHPRKG
ncbi:hypothetical protein N7466_003761 [Penicillium verhagenii]|uniref:uncharacterized protein n=1 Tax=Penicillium verhagenii TaxID=1562060 RepID=UPI00254559D0|nr:uncharacterized protein N7466_003761 [Penicillium verhagenii]KAJ5934214.1 hypothetical protein N7466_003761 [Penicillium verhagenii]